LYGRRGPTNRSGTTRFNQSTNKPWDATGDNVPR
jgi:hypothetical protein